MSSPTSSKVKLTIEVPITDGYASYYRHMTTGAHIVHYVLRRDGEPVCLIQWDTHNESCGVTLRLNEMLFELSKTEFELHVAFETFPVITMDEYREGY